MLFNSYEFILFFLPILLGTVFAFGLLGRKAASLALLVGSAAFYAYWDINGLALLACSIIGNYWFGRFIYDRGSVGALWLGVAANLAWLGYFKYRYFVAGFFVAVDPALQASLLIPLGISFYTLHQISFLVDCRRKRFGRPDSLSHYALYVTFFPQLIAGPIVRFSEVVDQFNRERAFSLCWRDTIIGLTMFAVGLFKKEIFADTFAAFANPVFREAAAGQPVGLIEAWIAALSYTLQIYFDFSGYSDMAIGLARLFGIRLPMNFNSPLRATSMIEFWRRWHITLSRFLRDYVFLPVLFKLGGQRGGKLKRHAIMASSVFLLMVVCGLWHGADWTFVLWGAIHGLLLAGNHITRGTFGPPSRHPGLAVLASKWIVTFTTIVATLVLFRSETLAQAGHMLTAMLGLDGRLPMAGDLANLSASPNKLKWLAVGMLVVLCLPNVQSWMRRYRPVVDFHSEAVDTWPQFLVWRPTLPWMVTAAALFLAGIASFGDTSQFIYWQF